MEDPNRRHSMTAVDIQQEYFETIGDADWELYQKKDRRFLLQKVAVALCGPPTKEGNLIDCVTSDGNQELKLQGYEARDEDTVMNVFNKILEQAKFSHNGENLIISVLRVVCVIPTRDLSFYEITPNDYWLDLHKKSGDSVTILVFHVFSIRACISMNSKVKGCRLFIDHDARVYETWLDYLNSNKLPKCVMVAPENGVYTGRIVKDGEMPIVNLTIQASPELGPGAKVLNAADTISTVANVGAMAAVVGSLFAAPVVAPVLVTTAVGVASVSGIYSIGRSIGTLVDRAQHEQSIGLESMEARSSWINIMVSTVGLSFTTAGKLLTWAASSGRNVKILMSALDFLKFTNLATGFIGVANGLGDMIFKFVRYGESPTALEVFQFTTSALFLGIGAMSNQTAQEIVQDAQANKINEYRDSLASNNKRRIFDKVTAETRRVQGTIDGNTDVIRALKTIENKDEFFGKLKNMNKSFNKNKVRVSLAPDGKVLINNHHRTNINEMHGLGRAGRNELLARYGPAKVTSKNAPTRIYSSHQLAGTSRLQVNEIIYNIRPEELVKISAFLINLTVADQDFLLDLLSTISEVLYDGFLLIITELIISLIPAELEVFSSIDPQWKRRMIIFVLQHLRSQITINEDDGVFMTVLKTYIRDGRIDKKMLLLLKEEVWEFFEKMRIDKYAHNKTWDEGDNYMSNNYRRSFNTLQVGQELAVGPHKILVKQITVDNFEQGLLNYSQEQCDLFMQLCLKLIESLSKEAVVRLNAINPDEDIMMRTFLFLLERFDTFIEAISTVDEHELVLLLKTEILEWCNRQRPRKQFTCLNCKGIRFCENK